MGKRLGKLIGYTFVILIIIYLLYTPPVRHAFSDVQKIFSNINFISDNNESVEPSNTQKAYSMPFPRSCAEIRNIYETYKEAFGTGNLTIIAQDKTIGMNASSGPMLRKQNNYIGCNFTANNYSKGQTGVFEIVVEKLINVSTPHRYTIHENTINIIDTFEPKPTPIK